MSSKSIETFTGKGFGDYSGSTVTAAGLIEDTVVLGDEKGNLITMRLGANKSTIENQQSGAFKGKIDKILVVPDLYLCYILASNKVVIYKLPKLDTCQSLEGKENIVAMCVNACNRTNCNRLAVITKKKKLKIFSVDPQSFANEETIKEISLEDIPDFYEWYDDIFCYNHKQKVHWLNLRNQQKLQLDMENVLGISYIQNSLVVVTGELGLFLEMSTPKSITPLTLEKNFVGFVEYKNYILALHNESIIIFSAVDQQFFLTQKITLNFGQTGKFLMLYGKRLICLTLNESFKSIITEYTEISYEILNKSLIADGKFDEALTKINDNVKSTDELKPEKIEKYFLDCGWASILRKDFEKAYAYIHLTNFNPFEIIYMFYATLEIKVIHDGVEQQINKDLARNQMKSLIGDDESKMKSAYKFLLECLSMKRMYLLNNYEQPRDNGSTVDFTCSETAKISLKNYRNKLRFLDVINSINLTLVKVMVMCKAPPKDIAYIIDSPSFDYKNCDLTKDSFFDSLNSEEADFAMAYFYEKKGDFDKALNIWKNYGTEIKGKGNPVFGNEAKERTKKIFYKFKHDPTRRNVNIKLFQDYLKWMLERYPEDAFEVVINTNYLSPEYFLNNIVMEVEKGNSDNNLREKFLIFFNEKNPDETYQTMLICEYVDKLFKMKDQNTPFNEIPFEGKLNQYYNIFMNSLRNKKSVYNKLSVLNKIKNTWLIEGEIFLYSGLKKHNEALNKLMGFALENKNETFERVEKYCDANFEVKPDIYADFLKLLIEKQKTYKGGDDKIKKEILEILRKYGDVEKLDPVFALENIPPESNVCEGVLYDYITKVIKEYTSLTNKYKISRNISDMALIYKEKEVLDAKNKSVTIDNDTVCELCKKKIAGTIFVVYPNMKIYHAKCAVNPSVCPTTGVDFSKKKMI